MSDDKARRDEDDGWEIGVMSVGGGGERRKRDDKRAADGLREIRAEKEAGGSVSSSERRDPWLERHLPPPGPNDHRSTIAGTGPLGSGAAAPTARLVVKGEDESDGGYSEGGPETSALPVAEDAAQEMSIFNGSDGVEPPVSFAFLLRLVRNSPSLRQNIDAYVRNVEGHGWRLVSVLDLSTEEADALVHGVIFAERVHQQRVALLVSRSIKDEAERKRAEDEALAVELEPTDAETAERRAIIEREAAIEKVLVETLLRNINPKMSLTEIRSRVRYDLEALGNAYVAITRNPFGEVVNLWPVPAFSVRMLLMKLEDRGVETEERLAISPVSFDKVTSKRSFRRYVQGLDEYGTTSSPLGTGRRGGTLVYFKEAGDPRSVGRRTGKVYKDARELEQAIKEGRESGPAEELVHFSLIGAGDSIYGSVRWEGVTVGAMGEVEAEQTNHLTFLNDCIPDMMIMVEGGRFARGARQEIEDHLRTSLRGKTRERSILVLEAKPNQMGSKALTGEAPLPKIHVIPLTQFHRTDGQFTKYTAMKSDQIDSAFGNPPMAVGKYQNIGSRATSDTLERWSERNVYQPERGRSDEHFNARVLSLLDVKYWRLESLAPSDRNPRELVELASIAVEKGWLTIDEARTIGEDAFGIDLPAFDVPEWSKMPLPVFLAKLKSVPAPDGAPGDFSPEEEQAKAILRTAMLKRANGGLSRDDVVEMLHGLRKELAGRMESLAREAELMGVDNERVQSLEAEAEADGRLVRMGVDRSLMERWTS